MTGFDSRQGLIRQCDAQDVRPVRVLQVLGGLDRAGIESWLLGVLSRTVDADVSIDFAVYGGASYSLQPEVESLGANVHELGHPSNPGAYAANLHRVLRDHGPYDVVHSHLDEMSGFVLTIARLAGVPVRIANSHTARPLGATGIRKLAYPLMRWLMSRNATVRVGCGIDAAEQVFGYGAPYSADSLVVHCGIDLSAFAAPSNVASLRGELGISPHTFVVGHVGRFVRQKNHSFLVEIAAEIVKRVPDTVFLLVGTGSLENEVRLEVRRRGLEKYFRFAGTRPDVPALMNGVMDVFLLPSQFEGLPMVLIEAQAADLHSVISDVITTEADVIPELLKRLTLRQSAVDWAEAVVRQRSAERYHGGAGRIADTDFSLDRSAQRLLELYGVDNVPVASAEVVPMAGGA